MWLLSPAKVRRNFSRKFRFNRKLCGDYSTAFFPFGNKLSDVYLLHVKTSGFKAQQWVFYKPLCPLAQAKAPASSSRSGRLGLKSSDQPLHLLKRPLSKTDTQWHTTAFCSTRFCPSLESWVKSARACLNSHGRQHSSFIRNFRCDHSILTVIYSSIILWIASFWSWTLLAPKISHCCPQLSNLWWMPNSVRKGFDTAMKTGSSRQFKRYPTTYRWVSSQLPFTEDWDKPG